MKRWNLFKMKTNLKKILIAAVFCAAFFRLSMAAECVLVIASKGAVKVTAAGYETGKDSTLALIAGQARVDLLPDSKIGPVSCSPAVKVKLIKGSAWVRCGKEKAHISSGLVTLESSNSVFLATTKQISVYSGFVTVKNNAKITRAGRSMCYDFAAGKITNISDETAGAALPQVKMDKFSLYCAVNLDPVDFITARSTFSGAFTAFYHAGQAFFSFDNPKEDYDLGMELKLEKKNTRYMLNGMIKNPLTSETVAIYSVDEAADETGMQRALTKAAIETARALQSYGSKVLTEGTTVFVEMEG